MPSLSISARELLTSGVHYGHKVSRWNPKMRPYIHAKKSLIHLIDVRETIKALIPILQKKGGTALSERAQKGIAALAKTNWTAKREASRPSTFDATSRRWARRSRRTSGRPVRTSARRRSSLVSGSPLRGSEQKIGEPQSSYVQHDGGAPAALGVMNVEPPKTVRVACRLHKSSI